MKSKSIFVLFSLALFFSCKKDNENTYQPKLIVKLVVDSTQVRLGNIGDTVGIPAGHAAQHPRFNKISAHYLELAPGPYTLLGQGAILYHAPETSIGGSTAIDFNRSRVVAPGEVFLELPLNEVPMGNFEWVRLSLSYQNYDVDYSFNGLPLTGTIASFVGYNTYLTSYTIDSQQVSVNGNRLQGYWGFETNGIVSSGQAPPGATTVPNPLFNSSPIPQGSCVVTGQFVTPLRITGTETEDITVTMSLSINNSFEWIDANGNGRWDAQIGGAESVGDMGLRGLIPSHNR